jgi:hypothetical protein
MGETELNLSAEYNSAYERHGKMLAGMVEESPEEVVEIAADLAARLELVGLIMPENLIVGIATSLQEQGETPDEPAASNDSDGGDQEAGTGAPVAESSS